MSVALATRGIISGIVGGGTGVGTSIVAEIEASVIATDHLSGKVSATSPIIQAKVDHIDLIEGKVIDEY